MIFLYIVEYKNILIINLIILTLGNVILQNELFPNMPYSGLEKTYLADIADDLPFKQYV